MKDLQAVKGVSDYLDMQRWAEKNVIPLLTATGATTKCILCRPSVSRLRKGTYVRSGEAAASTGAFCVVLFRWSYLDEYICSLVISVFMHSLGAAIRLAWFILRRGWSVSLFFSSVWSFEAAQESLVAYFHRAMVNSEKCAYSYFVKYEQ
eukprot:TRINITY_DN1383_c0_g1_i1.p1 TRINITY_DN1383_c0_g1~~TRINITY_DN1383_c0_g1_i1.p1  ORF type:complete len:150 (+),score=14.32 TRINITY_DN1383_c0_g1_i1:668-1117(+)